jgi:hypothetical protein
MIENKLLELKSYIEYNDFETFFGELQSFRKYLNVVQTVGSSENKKVFKSLISSSYINFISER